MGLLCNYTWLRIVRVMNYFMRDLFLGGRLNYNLLFDLDMLLLFLMYCFDYLILLCDGLGLIILYLFDDLLLLLLNNFIFLSILLFYLLLRLLCCLLRCIFGL
jgi:hypothetical protein